MSPSSKFPHHDKPRAVISAEAAADAEEENMPAMP